MFTRRLLPPRWTSAVPSIARSKTSPIRFSSTTAPVTIADRAFWKSLIPKPLRKDNHASGTAKQTKKREWNPATYFIVMFLFIGSMSIQMIALRHQTERYVRQSSLRIAQLREVVQRIQAGEDVDVERILGTGDPQREAEWEEVLQAIERDEAMRKPREKLKDSNSNSNSNSNSDSAQPKMSPEPAKETKTAGFSSFF